MVISLLASKLLHFPFTAIDDCVDLQISHLNLSGIFDQDSRSFK